MRFHTARIPLWLLLGALTLAPALVRGQRPGATHPRSEFISYDTREGAETGDPARSAYYIPLSELAAEGNDYSATFEVPFAWLNRDVFLHCEGSRKAFAVLVNGRPAGTGEDSRTPSEFLISDRLTEGANTVTLRLLPPGAGARLEGGLPDDTRAPFAGSYIYSQPKLRIDDFVISAAPDSTRDHGVLEIELVLSNSYNSEEKITAGFDIYDPAGKLKDYNIKEMTVAGNSTDTMRFRSLVYGAIPNLWSASSPRLYRVMLFIRQGGRVVEYVPVQVGFGTTEYADGRILRNGTPIEPVTARFNAPDDPAAALARLRELKKSGVNLLCVDYPQPEWFYTLCDRTGLYVIDRASICIDPAENGSRRSMPANDPAWLDRCLQRTEAMFRRSRNHVCIVGWSLGSPQSGNGYNMYKSYQLLRGLEPSRPVLFPGAGGEWNNDVTLPPARQ